MVHYKTQRIRDPLHDLIEFKAEQFENVMWDVVQTRPFQRLRRVKQLAFSELVFPGATHNRFAHSLGVFDIARRLMSIVYRHVGESGFNQHRAHVALAAALVHDVGHGPFSHSFEEACGKLSLPHSKHETVSAELISDDSISEAMNTLGGGFADEVAQLIRIDGPTDIYSAVVSSQFDADRLDYIQRDPMMTGTQHSKIDFTWLMSNLEIGKVPDGVDDEFTGDKETFVLNSKAFYAAETYVLGLFHLYPTVYFHKATRSAEKLFSELLLRLHCLVNNNSVELTGMTDDSPLVEFLKNPSINLFLSLDDTLIWGSIHQMSFGKDKSLAELGVRLRDRKLLKCIDIRQLFLQNRGYGVDEERLDKDCALASARIDEWLENRDSLVPEIILDSGKRPTYKRYSEGKGPLNRIHMNMHGELVDLSDVSKAVGASGTFKFLRAYTDGGDSDATKFIATTIDDITQGEKN